MSSMQNLSSIADFYKTDKYEHGYTKVYEKYFDNIRDQKLKILGSGEIKRELNISAHFASKQALEKIEKAGGKLSIIKK